MYSVSVEDVDRLLDPTPEQTNLSEPVSPPPIVSGPIVSMVRPKHQWCQDEQYRAEAAMVKRNQ